MIFIPTHRRGKACPSRDHSVSTLQPRDLPSEILRFIFGKKNLGNLESYVSSESLVLFIEFEFRFGQSCARTGGPENNFKAFYEIFAIRPI